MKKLSILMTLAAFLMAGAFMNSCQTDDVMLEVEVLVCENDILPVFENDLPDCEEVCVGEEPFVQGVVSSVQQWAPIADFQYFQNNKYFTAEVWNDGETFYVKSTVFGYQYDRENTATSGRPNWVLVGPTCVNYPFETVKITINGIVFEISMDDPDTEDIIETATEYTAEFSLEELFPDGWNKCDEIEYNVRLEGNGPPVELEESMTYSLYEACAQDCDYKMTAAVICDNFYRTTTFTYVAKEDGYLNLQGGLTRWVYGQSLKVLIGESDVTEHFIFTKGTPVQKINGVIEACVEYTFIINWEYKKTIGDGTKDEGEEEVDEWTATLYEYEIIEDEVVPGEIISVMNTPKLMECGDSAIAVIVE